MGPGSSPPAPLQAALLQQAATVLEHRPRTLVELSTALTLGESETTVLLAQLTALGVCEEAPTGDAPLHRRFRLRRGVTARSLAGNPSYQPSPGSSPRVRRGEGGCV